MWSLFVALNIRTLSYYSQYYNAECHISFIVILNVVMLSVVMLSVVMLSVVMLSVVMLSVVMLSVVMLSVMFEAPYLLENVKKNSQVKQSQK